MKLNNEAMRPLEADRHLELTGSTDARLPGSCSEAANLMFIRSVIHDLQAFADAREMPAIRGDAEAAKQALTLELERASTAIRDVAQ